MRRLSELSLRYRYKIMTERVVIDMKQCECIAFIGGDQRQIRVINQMSKAGAKIRVFGFGENSRKEFDENIEFAESIDELSDKYRAIILPLPYSTDGENINTAFDVRKLSLSNVLKIIRPKSCILAGRCDEKLRTLAQVCDIILVDYFEREELMVFNAVPTAEGAIQIAMEETAHTINNSECLVIGNGRISKILCKMLLGLGAKVTISARKYGDLAYAQTFGYSAVPIWELQSIIDEFDIIFNTVPALILDRRMLSKIRKNSLVIDLASKPGGVDFESAKELGIKVIWALSLPGKVAPDTAGDIIADTILNILDEMEV